MAQAFEEFADAYEAMIDWPKRLANEEPFYRRVFERVGAGRVLDAACGAGRHAAMFHSWGMQVEGADVSEAMIRRCREAYGESETLRWVVRGFQEPPEEPGAFDVAICTGNSLALAPELVTIELAVRRLIEAVRPGGAVVLHVLNLWRLGEGECVWQKCVRTDLGGGDSLIVKGVHRCGTRGYVDLVVADLAGAAGGGEAGAAKVPMRADSARFWGLQAGDLERMAIQGGASSVEVFGDYAGGGYDPAGSADLIVVAGV